MKIIINNLATEYTDQGSGPVVMLLHGWGGSLHGFDLLVPNLVTNHRVIRLDLPGFGGTEAPSETWNLDDYINFVKSFVQKLDLKIDVLVGHSFGGRISIKGLASGGLTANKLILIGSAGLAKSQTLRNQILKGLTKIGNLVSYLPPLIFWRQQLKRKLYRAIGSDYLDAGVLKQTYLKIIAEDLSDVAPKVATPTLLIWGEKDVTTPLADGRRLATLIPHSQLEIIKDADHDVHQQKPNEVSELINKFL